MGETGYRPMWGDNLPTTWQWWAPPKVNFQTGSSTGAGVPRKKDEFQNISQIHRFRGGVAAGNGGGQACQHLRQRPYFAVPGPDFWGFLSHRVPGRWLVGDGRRAGLFVQQSAKDTSKAGGVAGHQFCHLSGRIVPVRLSRALPLSWKSYGCAAHFTPNRRHRHENYSGVFVPRQLRHVVLALAAKAQNSTSNGIIRSAGFTRLNSFTLIEQTPSFWR